MTFERIQILLFEGTGTLFFVLFYLFLFDHFPFLEKIIFNLLYKCVPFTTCGQPRLHRTLQSIIFIIYLFFLIFSFVILVAVRFTFFSGYRI